MRLKCSTIIKSPSSNSSHDSGISIFDRMQSSNINCKLVCFQKRNSSFWYPKEWCHLLSQTIEHKSQKPEVPWICSKFLDRKASPKPLRYLVSVFLKQTEVDWHRQGWTNGGPLTIKNRNRMNCLL